MSILERNKLDAVHLSSIVSVTNVKGDIIDVNEKFCNISGMTRKELKNITQAFYQIDRDIEHSSDGVGLGLSIVRHLVNLHHGEFIITSKEGKGTRAKIVL